jgi:hypothetical protein
MDRRRGQKASHSSQRWRKTVSPACAPSSALQEHDDLKRGKRNVSGLEQSDKMAT